MNPVTETELASKSFAPRVTPQAIEDAIASEHYFTAAQALAQLAPKLDASDPLCMLTFCVLVLENGLTVTGQSACASWQNFNAEIGRRLARKDAVSKIGLLLGFALREKLHNGTISRGTV